MNQTHPEQELGEIFVRNLDQGSFDALPWLTKRRGTKAYDGNGNLLTAADWWPVFIQAYELRSMRMSLQDVRHMLMNVPCEMQRY